MARSVAKELMERRASLIEQMQEIAQRGVTEDRDLSGEEQQKFDRMYAEAEKLAERAKAIADGESRAKEIEESFRGVTGREPGRQGGEPAGGSGLGEWARNAQIGDGFNLAPVRGAERRALARVVGGEQRAMSATGGVDQDGVYGQLWEYAVAGSQILQAGVDIINTTDGNTLPFPRVTAHSQTSDTATAANAALTESDATIDTVNLDVAKHAYLTLVPSELVQDATFDLEGYLARAAGRELGRRVSKVASAAAVAGFTTAGATGSTSATAVIEYENLVDLFHSVLPEYRSQGAWLMSDPGAALIRKLTDNNGQPLWQPALTAGNPDLIMGDSVFIDPFLPSPDPGAKSVYYGDLSALKVRIAGGLRFERSNEYAFGNDQIAFRAVVRAGAAALDANAVKYYQHGAAA